MERYSGIRPTEGVPVETGGEWTGPGGETGLEEPMWQLRFGGGTDSYPERPDEPDCIFYLRTGYCGYGSRCRFNHPHDRVAAMGTLNAGGSDYPERAVEPVCQYYLRTGMCKFGVSCKYHHPKHVVGSSTPATLNFYGYPLRRDEPECYHYIKTGQCKFGVTCKFHHPQPAGIQVSEQDFGLGALASPIAVPTPAVYPTAQSPAQSSQQYGVISGNWPIARPPILPPGSYVPGSYGRLLLSPGVVSVPGWTIYPASSSPVASPSTQPRGTQLSPAATDYTGSYLSVSSAIPSSSSRSRKEFPERLGQPECQYYLRTGDCKFGYTCKYHHPPDRSAPKSNFVLSLMGLPLRPGAPVCSHYAQHGVCKFGPLCKFDHPMGTSGYGSSASSLSDMSVAHNLLGSRTATFAPSSSTEVMPELISNFGKIAFSSSISSSSSSSASVGSMFSKGMNLPQPSIEVSVQGSTTSNTASSTSLGSKAHTSS